VLQPYQMVKDLRTGVQTRIRQAYSTAIPTSSGGHALARVAPRGRSRCGLAHDSRFIGLGRWATAWPAAISTPGLTVAVFNHSKAADLIARGAVGLVTGGGGRR
jgi:hypothetical protein